MNLAPSPSAQVVKQAIQWSLRLRHADADAQVHAQFAQWRTAHATHEQAWQRIELLNANLNDTFEALPGAGVAFETLENSAHRLRRRQAMKLLSGALLISGAGTWLTRHYPVWSADFATAVGQCQRYPLANGSQVQLNTDSAVSLTGPGQLVLQQGEILLECNSPIRLADRYARFDALAGRFVIRQEPTATRVSVLQGQLRAYPVEGAATLLQAGQHYRLGPDGLQHLPGLDMEAGAWAEGLIVTRNMRLGDFLAEVGRYRHGYLGCPDDIADLRLSGVYRLADTDQLLATLPRTLPVQLSYRTRWWVQVERRA